MGSVQLLIHNMIVTAGLIYATMLFTGKIF